MRDNFCCSCRLIGREEVEPTGGTNTAAAAVSISKRSQVTVKYCQNLISTMTRKFAANNSKPAARSDFRFANRASTLLLMVLAVGALGNSYQMALAGPSTSQATSAHRSSNQSKSSEQLPAQARAGGLEPGDYVDEAGELDVLVNQQQIPTAQLLAAAGHLVPDNFFLPGGTIPANILYQQQYLQQQQQQQQQAQQQSHQQHQHQTSQDALQQAASQVQTRTVPAPGRYANQAARSVLAPVDLLMAAAAVEQQAHDGPGHVSSLLEHNGYALTTQPDPRDAAAQMDLLEFLAAPQAMSSQQIAQLAALYDQHLAQQQHHHHNHHQQQQQQQQQQQANLIDHMQALASNQQAQQQEQGSESEHYVAAPAGPNSVVGSEYQLLLQPDYALQAGGYEGKSNSAGGEQQYGSASNQYNNNNNQQHPPQRPFGLPTKSSNKEPSGMMKPMGNPKTVSSPIIDFAANNLPKSTGLEKLADKMPQHQTPTVFSFASSKDPSEKVKSVNQKKRNVMRQAEQIARLMIKSFNDKFGTNLGDQSDIPFLLSSLGPLGFAQNILLDPTLLVSLLNTAEKTYFSDVLPGPAKQVVKPVLNFFRVPNKKRGDKANLSNIISYLASGGQTASNVPSKHRQSFGIEKTSSKIKHK